MPIAHLPQGPQSRWRVFSCTLKMTSGATSASASAPSENAVRIMPKVIIDSQEIVVPAGTKVIDAAERLGILIPRFCYHPALGSLGACRMCAVKFEEGPIRGLEMSCMVEAKEGMVVSTTDQEAVDFRKYRSE